MNGGHRIKLGVYPFTTLKEARLEAYRRLGDRDGQAVEKDAPAAEEVVKKFIEVRHAQSRPSTRKEQERLLMKHFLSRYKDVPLNRITKKNILEVIDSLKELPSEQLQHTARSRRSSDGRRSGK